MRWRQLLPALGAGFAVLVGAASAAAQQAGIVASPPANATVFRVGEGDWRDAICAGKLEADVRVPATDWIEIPLGWIAVDEATARANWKSMAFTIARDDRPAAPPAGLRWQTASVRLDCPTQSLAGFFLGPVFYLPPARTEQSFRFEYSFKDDVYDGWSTFKKGTKQTMVLRLHPLAAKGAPAQPPTEGAGPAPALALPQLTNDQKWNRLQAVWAMWIMGSAAQMKALGKAPTDYGRFVGHLFASGWDANLTPAGLLQGWYRNASMFRTTKFQVLQVSDSVASARATRPWAAILGAVQDVGGITPAELDDVLAGAMQQIADEHGLKFEQVRDGDDYIITVRRK